MTMMRWNPWSDRSPFERNLERFFDVLGGPQSASRDADNLRVDVEDNSDHYNLSASLPGFEPKDVDISITGRTVAITAESSHEKETKEDRYVLRERYNGTLMRRLVLPAAVDAQKAAAAFKNGVLTISLPKASGAETHKVAIGAGE